MPSIRTLAQSITIPHWDLSLVASLSLSAGLFLVNLDHIVLLHLQRLRIGLQAICATFVAKTRVNVVGVRMCEPFRRKVIYLWRFVIVDPAAVEEETQRGDRDTHLREGVIVVVSYIELQVTLSL